MKTLKFFIQVLFTFSFLTPLWAMDKPRGEYPEDKSVAKYSLSNILWAKLGAGRINLVKKISCNRLVIFPEYSDGIVLNFNNQTSYKLEYWNRERLQLPCDVFEYVDRDNQSLLIAYQLEHPIADVYNLFEEKPHRQPLFLGDHYLLCQRADDSLELVDTNEQFSSEIFPRWKEITAKDAPKNIRLFRNSSPFEWSGLEKNTGTVMGWVEVFGHSEFKPDKDLFDFDYDRSEIRIPHERLRQSATDQEKKSFLNNILSWNTISCYHETLDGWLYCGHAAGLVTIWKFNQQE